MEILNQQGWKAEAEPQAQFPQEFIPHGHVWPSGVVLPPAEVDLYNLYTGCMNAQIDNAAMWPVLRNDRSLFLTACLNEAEAARARTNPMELFRRAVAAQEQLWDVLGQLERLHDIEDDDKACDQLADEIKSFACNGTAARLTVFDLMQFIDAMGHRRVSQGEVSAPALVSEAATDTAGAQQ